MIFIAESTVARQTSNRRQVGEGSLFRINDRAAVGARSPYPAMNGLSRYLSSAKCVNPYSIIFVT